MTNIIDIHSHILPGLDDGAADMEESMKMLRLARRQGITQIAATPHYSAGFPNICPEKIRELCRKVQESARQKLQTEFYIWPGQEIMFGNDVVHLLDNKDILTIADSRYVLVEFLPGVPYSGLLRAVRELVLEGYVPILAHSERYICLREQGRIDDLKAQGAYIQLNFRRIGGKWYENTTRWCRRMLQAGKVDFLGTDMHNSRERRPETAPGIEWMQKHLSRDYIDRILSRNQKKVLADEKI